MCCVRYPEIKDKILVVERIEMGKFCECNIGKVVDAINGKVGLAFGIPQSAKLM